MKLLRTRLIVLTCLYGVVQLCQLQEDEKQHLEAYIKHNSATINTRYKLLYHVTPPVGWMNDPNGFIYYKERYHLFYQFYPYDTKWGPMHWGHVSSPDLVNWEQMPTALLPENGVQCFSGSAVDMNGILVLMYTGGSTGNAYQQTQYLAYSDDGKEFYKYLGNPVLSPSNNTQDFRDPKVWRHEDHWYVVIGSKTDANLGRVLLYRSNNLVNWEFQSELASSSDIGKEGFMWECPDFFELNGKYVLIISPQGMNATADKYKNLYQTGTIIGNFNYTTSKFEREICFEELDYGHDFYATQTTLVNGKRILIAWLGMWESNFTEAAEDGWVGALTLPRELSLVDNRVLMTPVESIIELRTETAFNGSLSQNDTILSLNYTGELNITNLNLDEDIELKFGGINGGGEILLKWNATLGKVVLDRDGDIRQAEWEPKMSTFWRIFLDASSIEIFCGDGDVVFSSRVYPYGTWKVMNMGQQTVSVVAYSLKKSVS